MSPLDFLPKPPPRSCPRLTAEHKTAILAALAENDWNTVREAYGWAWNTLGIRVTYVTFWRFIESKGMLAGDTLRSRRLQMA
jgi:hypothetical protein